MTTNRIRYNYEFLQGFCKENNVTLLKDYSNEIVNRKTIIEGKCCVNECGDIFIKSFNTLCINKNFGCLTHSEKIKRERINIKTMEIYGVENVSQSDIIKKKKEETCIKNYGVSSGFLRDGVREKTNIALKADCVKEKRKKTNIDKYGASTCLVLESSRMKCNNALKTESVKEKRSNTNLIRYGNVCSLHCIENQEKVKNTLKINYGVDNPSKNKTIQEKKEKTCIKNHGVRSPFQMDETKLKNGIVMIENKDEIQKKRKTTSLQNWGVEYPSQSPEVMEKCSKNAYKLKDYTFPSGNIIKIQGYEHYALNDLLKEGILEEDIINGCKNVPEIWYEDENNKNHRHYVDIFIPSQNRCIEVKSTWTAEKKKDCIFLKQQAGKGVGYNYEIWVYNASGKKVECHT
jgi:hypothetical protein